MFDQAIILLKQEVQTNPKNAEAHMLLGAAYLGNGMTALADQELNTATVLDDGIKNEASKRCYEVAKLLVKNNKAQAHTALMKAKEYDPLLDKDEQFFFLANVDTEDNDSSRTDAAKRYLTLFPAGTNRAQATYAVAEGLLSNGAREESKSYFQQLTTQFPGTEWSKKAADTLANWIDTKDVVISAQQMWVDTGVVVVSGQSITLHASGTWDNARGDPSLGFGPNGRDNLWPGTILASARLGALIGKIGNNIFLVGDNYSANAPASGKLLLTINDVPGTFDDNWGAVNVRISYRSQ